MWHGATFPWVSFLHNAVIQIYRLIFLGILIHLLIYLNRNLPPW
jgi:hypothetical protein